MLQCEARGVDIIFARRLAVYSGVSGGRGVVDERLALFYASLNGRAR